MTIYDDVVYLMSRSREKSEESMAENTLNQTHNIDRSRYTYLKYITSSQPMLKPAHKEVEGAPRPAESAPLLGTPGELQAQLGYPGQAGGILHRLLGEQGLLQ